MARRSLLAIAAIGIAAASSAVAAGPADAQKQIIDKVRERLSGDNPKPITREEAAAIAAAPASSKAYAEATAHDPHFEDASLWWPYDVSHTQYAKEEWSPARVLKFRHTSGGPYKLSDAKNWINLATGQPATKGPDENTDVVLPDSNEEYVIARESPVHMRHVTWGRNAIVRDKRTPTDFVIHGNLWVKKGGNFFHPMRKHFESDRNTFCRNDNVGGAGAQYVIVDKGKGSSIEFVGAFAAGDSVRFESGTLIVAPHTFFGLGARNIFELPKGSAVQVQSGSYFGKRNAQQYTPQEMVVLGVLRAGSADRPIRRPVYLGCSQYDYSWLEDKPIIYGLTVGPTGAIEVHTADPKTAMLVIGHHFLKTHRSTRLSHLHKLDARPDSEKKIAIAVYTGAKISGPIVIEDLPAGHLFLENPKALSQWKDVTFGSRSVRADQAVAPLTEYLRKHRPK